MWCVVLVFMCGVVLVKLCVDCNCCHLWVSRLLQLCSFVSMPPKRRSRHGAALVAECLPLPDFAADATAHWTSSSSSGLVSGTAVVDDGGRADFPLDHTTTRGGYGAAVDGLAADGIELLVAQLANERCARTSIAPRASLLRTWVKFHGLMFGTLPDAPPVHPVTVRSFISISALFKRGGYRSFANYASAARMEHVDRGFVWSQQLEGISRWCTRSVLLGRLASPPPFGSGTC